MKRLLHTAALGMAVSLAATGTQAASLEIEWQNPDDYEDIRAAHMSQQEFQRRVIDELTAEFESTAERLLPEAQSLRINVSNVDLAGEVEYLFTPDPATQQLRVVRDIYFPSMTFEYELLGSDDRVIKSGMTQAQDQTFYFFGEYQRNDPLFFEKRLIERWFHKTFSEQIDS